MIRETFKKGPVFVGYLTAGDGGIPKSIAYAKALIKGGVNLLEIGVPFSDPIADGPVIQRAMHRALSKYHCTLSDVLLITKSVKEEFPTIPIILFSYFNPLFAASEKFFNQAKASGVDGILIVDLPVEEAKEFYGKMREHHLHAVHVITPSSSEQRIQYLDQQNESFLYYACRKGTTGIQEQLPKDLSLQLKHIKKIAQAPIAVGFGIADQQSAKQILKLADGFVVGSYFVKAIEDGVTPEILKKLAEDIDPRN